MANGPATHRVGSLRRMEASEYIAVLRDRSAALVASARTDLEAPVPSCPGWTVAELLSHVGATWGWAAAIVRAGARVDPPAVPDGVRGTELVGWAEEQSHQVIEALETADADSNCWTFGLPRSRLFWFRRQALETAVHAWDGQRAVGHPEAIDPELACDGVDEFLAVMLPRQIQRHSHGWTGQSLHLHRTDGDGEWTVRLGPGTAVAAVRAHDKGDVALRGPASSIYLWCVGRLPSSDLEVLGDRTVADRWTSEVAF
jgi:uncharacterized protein (TIGR03083 family)